MFEFHETFNFFKLIITKNLIYCEKENLFFETCKYIKPIEKLQLDRGIFRSYFGKFTKHLKKIPTAPRSFISRFKKCASL